MLLIYLTCSNVVNLFNWIVIKYLVNEKNKLLSYCSD